MYAHERETWLLGTGPSAESETTGPNADPAPAFVPAIGTFLKGSFTSLKEPFSSVKVTSTIPKVTSTDRV